MKALNHYKIMIILTNKKMINLIVLFVNSAPFNIQSHPNKKPNQHHTTFYIKQFHTSNFITPTNTLITPWLTSNPQSPLPLRRHIIYDPHVSLYSSLSRIINRIVCGEKWNISMVMVLIINPGFRCLLLWDTML